MNKTEQLYKLFSEWEENGNFESKGKRGQFIKDGIVCLEKYEESPLKVLFMLKDTDDANPEIVYCRGVCDEVLQSDNSGQTWNRVAEWSRALTTGDSSFLHVNNLKKEETEEVNEKDGMRKYFKKVAIMNLKKASGKGKIPYYELKKYVNSNQLHINNARKEIEIIDPDVIVACSPDVFAILHDEIFKEEKFQVTQTQIFSDARSKFIKCFDIHLFSGSKHPVYVIEYRHPSNGCSAEKSYNDMLKIREFIQNK